ncbi:MAG: glycosyltransferase family 4 protein [Candidatus Aminicenantes bacterium]|nr:glycosyltransferase family 4 protein [Candidatus Aminicenantes bacterium]
MSLFQLDAGKEWRGGQKQTLLLTQELLVRGYSVHLIVQPDSPLHQKASEASVPVWPLRMRSEMDFLAVLKLGRKMKRHRGRLVHFHDAHSLAIGSAAASWAKIPLRVISRKVDFPLKANPLSRIKYTKDIDVVIAVSQEVKGVLAEGGIDPEKIRVIPDGVDYSSFEDVASSAYLRNELSFALDDFLVGIVAHLADHKGHKYLIEATRVLKQKAPKVKVIIVGAGPLKIELSKQAREIHVEDMVFFLGFRDDIPQIMASLDLFVLSSYLEGMGSSILEAMASRLPVVATQAGGIPEVVVHEETGLLVPSRDSAALADAIIRIYKDRKFGKLLGQRGYELVHRKFSARAMASKVIDEYERIAKEKNVKLLL